MKNETVDLDALLALAQTVRNAQYQFGHPARHLADAVPSLIEELEATREQLAELLDAYEDACHQGSGNEPLSSPTWHNFMSTWEQADTLIPKVRRVLSLQEKKTLQ